MKNKVIAAFTGLVAIASARALDPSPALPGFNITLYPNGVPSELKPLSRSLAERQGSAPDNSGVYLCNDIDFEGYCVHIVAPFGKCVPLGSDLDDQVSSVGPDSPDYCFFFNAAGCSDSQGHFGTYSPGYTDLRDISFNDVISSYYCNPN